MENSLEGVLGVSHRAGVALGCAGTALAGLVECLDHALTCATMVNGGWNKWLFPVPLILERIPTIPFPFDKWSRVSKWISFSSSLGACLPLFFFFFHCVPGNVYLHTAPQLSFPSAGWYIGGGSFNCLPLSFLSISMCFLFHLLCRSCLVSLQFFFGRNCSVCRCRFVVFVRGGEFRVFLCYHLGPLLC